MIRSIYTISTLVRKIITLQSMRKTTADTKINTPNNGIIIITKHKSKMNVHHDTTPLLHIALQHASKTKRGYKAKNFNYNLYQKQPNLYYITRLYTPIYMKIYMLMYNCECREGRSGPTNFLCSSIGSIYNIIQIQ